MSSILFKNISSTAKALIKFSDCRHASVRCQFVYKQISDTLNTNLLRKYCIMSIGKPKIVFVLGPPGAGKGTQCEKISNNFGYVHLSAGDLLREERNREGSEFGELIETKIKEGKIVPVAVTCSLLENAMNKYMKESGKDKFLIDGFPRNQDNLDGWTEQMSKKVNMQFVLFFDCEEDLCVDRCLNRGKLGSARVDDNIDSLKQRFNTYINDSMPIINYYKKLNLVRQIDSSLNPEKVFEKVKEAFVVKHMGEGEIMN